MLLYLSDWDMFPEAIVDTKTKNESFLRLASVYKQMGIKNHAFPLALLNPKLQGVDPHDPNLTLEQKIAIVAECKLNAMYYLREVVRVPSNRPDEVIRFRANRAIIAVYWLFFNNITTVLIQPRQTGKSFGCDTLARYLTDIRCNNTHINMYTKDDTLRRTNLDRLKKISENLPDYLQMVSRKDTSNLEEYTVKALGNKYTAHLPQKSDKAAQMVGRGLTSPINFIDEAAYFYNIGISLPSLLSAGNAARDMARRLGEPWGTLIMTTAGKLNDRDGKYVYDILKTCAPWTESFFDCANKEELEQVIRSNSATAMSALSFEKEDTPAVRGVLRVNCTFSHRQLGFTDGWLLEKAEETNSVGEDFERDYLNIWTSGSAAHPLPTELLDKINEGRKNGKDKYVEITKPQGYIINWYIPQDRIQARMSQDKFVMGLDTSDAVGKDFMTMCIRSVSTGEIVASGMYNETNTITFAEWLASLLIEYPNITLIPERRSTGTSIIDVILRILVARRINPFRRIYNTIVQEREIYPERFNEMHRQDNYMSNDLVVKYRRNFGFATSAVGTTSRTNLYSETLTNAAKLTGTQINDNEIIEQLLSLVIKNGRVDHPDGMHDDAVIAWLLSFWLITKGQNLQYYNIEPRTILVNNANNMELNNPKVLAENREQQRLREEIEKTMADLRKEKDQFVSAKLEHYLKYLNTQIAASDRETYSIDSFIEELKKSRFKNRGYR